MAYPRMDHPGFPKKMRTSHFFQYNKTFVLTGKWGVYVKHEDLGPRARKYCNGDLPDCYYLKLTNCSIDDAIDSIEMSHNKKIHR
jgi:hypothetical protein